MNNHVFSPAGPRADRSSGRGHAFPAEANIESAHGDPSVETRSRAQAGTRSGTGSRPRVSDSGRAEQRPQHPRLASFRRRAAARSATRPPHAINISSLKAPVLLRWAEPEAAGASSGRFVATADRRGCRTSHGRWFQLTTGARAGASGAPLTASDLLGRLICLGATERHSCATTNNFQCARFARQPPSISTLTSSSRRPSATPARAAPAVAGLATAGVCRVVTTRVSARGAGAPEPEPHARPRGAPTGDRRPAVRTGRGGAEGGRGGE